MPKKTNKALDWAKHCAKSHGVSHMMPEKLKARGEKLLKDADKLTEMGDELNRKQADFSIDRDNLWHDVRKELEAKGVKDAFRKKMIDFDANARAEGFLVVNLLDDPQDRPMGRPMQM